MSDELEAPGPDEPGDSRHDLDGVVLDESFIRAARIKEPSARARMLAAQWARQPQTAAPAPAEPELASADEPADPGDSPSHPWARFWSTVRTGAVVLTVLALIVVVLSENYFNGRPPSQTGRPGAFPGSGPAAGDPFAGTPAESYANGPDGIVLPDRSTLRDTQGFTANDIDNALITARQILVEANLNPRTLRGGGPPMAVEDWLEAADRDRLERTFAKPPTGGDPTDFVTRFDPSQTDLVGYVVKVKGTLTYRVVAPGRLAVYAAYLFVYPVRTANSASPAHRVVVRRFNEFDFTTPAISQAAVASPAGNPGGDPAVDPAGATGADSAAAGAPTPAAGLTGATDPKSAAGKAGPAEQAGPSAPATASPSAPAPATLAPDGDTSPIRLGPASSDFAGVACQPPDGFLHPDFTLGATPRLHSPGATADPYDLSRPYNAVARCVPVDRT